MHLQRHARAQVTVENGAVDRDHRKLDQVGGGPLQRRVSRRPFSKPAQVRVAGLNVRDGAYAAESGANSLVAANGFERPVDKAPDTGVALKVAVDVSTCLALIYSELRGEAERRD